MLNELTTDQLIAGVDILDLFREVTDSEPKKRGQEYWWCCPIHNENTPSCSVNEDKQIFNCYGCGAAGSAADFLVHYHSISLHEAFNMLRDRIGGTITEAPEIRLTEKGQAAMTLKHASEIEQPYFFAEYNHVEHIHETYNGQSLIVLSDGKRPVDFVLENELRRYKKTEQGFHILGEYHENCIVTSDYIDALYLRKHADSQTMIVFAGHPAHLQFTIDTMKRKGCKRITLAVPNIWDHIRFAELCSEPMTTPAETGYWCELDRKQAVNL